MSYSWCGECRAYHTEGYHNPSWWVWCDEKDEGYADAREIRALDAEQAAGRWAEDFDCESGEYSILDGDEVTVSVARVGRTPVVQEFVVFGESEPVYTAREVEKCHASG